MPVNKIKPLENSRGFYHAFFVAAFGEIAHIIRPLTANRRSCYNITNTTNRILSRKNFYFFLLDFFRIVALYSHQRRPRGTHGGIVGAADAKKITIIYSQIRPDQHRKVWLFVCLIGLYILYINRLPVHYCMLVSFIIPP